MTKEELYSHPGWQWCTSEGSELHTLLIGLETTFREKLEWLEEAETLTLIMKGELTEPPRKTEDITETNQRPLGGLEGKITVSPDFDEESPEVLALFGVGKVARK